MSPEIAWKPPILYGFFKFLRIHGSISSENPQTPRRKRLNVIKAASFRVMHRKGAQSSEILQKVVWWSTCPGVPPYSPWASTVNSPFMEQWWILGRAPLIFRPNWCPKGWKKFFWDPLPLTCRSGSATADTPPRLCWFLPFSVILPLLYSLQDGQQTLFEPSTDTW